MSIIKKEVRLKTELIATEIYFTERSIVYKVKTKNEKKCQGIVCCVPDIKNKDLVLKTTFLDCENMEVIFSPIYVTPHFYQDIIEGRIKNIKEYSVEKRSIYSVGDVVGFVIF
jgi:hypothetical protein